jgi:hypothetical protein
VNAIMNIQIPKIWGISWVDEDLLASQKGFCTIELVGCLCVCLRERERKCSCVHDCVGGRTVLIGSGFLNFRSFALQASAAV